MEKKEYQRLVKEITPKPKKLPHIVLAFLSGGIIGCLAEIFKLILVNFYSFKNSDAISIVMFSVIVLACFFTVFLDMDKWVIKFKAGLIVPITGFAHSISSSAMDYKRDGLVTGVGSNFFKLAGSVILYGIVSAFIFCIIKVVFYG